MAQTTQQIRRFDNWRDMAPEFRLADTITLERTAERVRSPINIAAVLRAAIGIIATVLGYTGIAAWRIVQGLWMAICVAFALIAGAIYVTLILAAISLCILVVMGIVRLFTAVVDLFSVLAVTQ